MWAGATGLWLLSSSDGKAPKWWWENLPNTPAMVCCPSAINRYEKKSGGIYFCLESSEGVFLCNLRQLFVMVGCDSFEKNTPMVLKQTLQWISKHPKQSSNISKNHPKCWQKNPATSNKNPWLSNFQFELLHETISTLGKQAPQLPARLSCYVSNLGSNTSQVGFWCEKMLT